MSPYSGGRNKALAEGHRFPWARLNADTLFLALLAFLSGLVDMVYPTGDETVAEIGFPTPSFYLRCAMYLAAGLMLLLSLARQHIPTEVMARMTLVVATIFELWRTGRIFGWTDGQHLIPAILLVLVVAGTTYLRLSVLLDPKGLVVRVPERRSP